MYTYYCNKYKQEIVFGSPLIQNTPKVCYFKIKKKSKQINQQFDFIDNNLKHKKYLKFYTLYNTQNRWS